MSDPSTKAYGLKHGSLAGQDLSLLRPGSSVLLGNTSGQVYVLSKATPEGLNLSRLPDGMHLEKVQRGRLTYIGERDADGWIHAPAGGWTEDLFSGLDVFEVLDVPGGMARRENAQDVDWSSIIAFRASPSAAGTAPDLTRPAALVRKSAETEHEPEAVSSEGKADLAALAAAYEAGAQAVHDYWTENPGEAPRGDPEFSEAAYDYACSVAPAQPQQPECGHQPGCDCLTPEETVARSKPPIQQPDTLAEGLDRALGRLSEVAHKLHEADCRRAEEKARADRAEAEVERLREANGFTYNFVVALAEQLYRDKEGPTAWRKLNDEVRRYWIGRTQDAIQEARLAALQDTPQASGGAS